jgi:hypothetical protein
MLGKHSCNRSWMAAKEAASSLLHGRAPVVTNRCNCTKQIENTKNKKRNEQNWNRIRTLIITSRYTALPGNKHTSHTSKYRPLKKILMINEFNHRSSISSISHDDLSLLFCCCPVNHKYFGCWLFCTPLGWIQDVAGPKDQRLRCPRHSEEERRTPRRVAG